MAAATRLAQASIKIPKYIERGPTDILKALASTVKFTPNVPHAGFQDDPYLLPTRPNESRIFMLSKLNGRKTAKFILNKHPELFLRDDAEPKVEAYLPMEEFRADMEFTSDDIKWCIENNDAENGIIAFKYLEENKIKLDNELLLQFYELLCYTNEEKLADSNENLRSKLFSSESDRFMSYTWKKNGYAVKLFNQLKEQLPDQAARIHSAMIAGLLKFNEFQAAKKLYDDFVLNNPEQPLHLKAYNSLLKSLTFIHSSSITAFEAQEEIVKHMEANLVEPNLETFNAILGIIKFYKSDDSTCIKAFEIFNDMKSLNIKPSLGSYGALLMILSRYKNGQVYSEIIKDVLNYVDDNLDVSCLESSEDVKFLGSNIRTLTTRMNSPSLVKKLHKIFMKNPNLFGTTRQQNLYLCNYFKFIATTENLDTVMKFYNQFYPYYFTPDKDCYDALTEVLDVYQADDEVIKKVGQDILSSRLAKDLIDDKIYRRHPEYVEKLEQMKQDGKFARYSTTQRNNYRS